MPESKDFNNTDQEWHYALSWMACDYIAATQGEARLWELIDAMHNGGEGTSDAQQNRVLDQLLGFDVRFSSPPAPPRGSATCTAESRLTTAGGHTDRDPSVVRTRVWRSRTTACQSQRPSGGKAHVTEARFVHIVDDVPELDGRATVLCW